MRGEIRVVAGAIVRDGQVLAALRGPGMSQAGLWELPGGKVEPDETDQDALVRELLEELHVEVVVGRWLGEAVHAYGDRVVRLVAYACTLAAGEPDPLEHEAVRWVGPEALHGLRWAPADLPLLEAVRRCLSPPPPP